MMTHETWWVWIVRSACTALFAMIALAFPPLTTTLAVHLYGAYVKLDGFMLIGMNRSDDRRHAWLLLAGFAALGSGVAILLWPEPQGTTLALTLAVLCVLRGLFEATNAIACANVRVRALRIANAAFIVSLGMMLAAYEALQLQSLVMGFAVFGTLAALCQAGVALEQYRLATRPSAVQRRPRVRSLDELHV